MAEHPPKTPSISEQPCYHKRQSQYRLTPVADKWQRLRWGKWGWAIITCLICGALFYHGSILFRIVKFKNSNPATTAFIEERIRKAVAQGVAPKKEQTWIPYERISTNLVRAVLAGEDIRFFHHSGVDLAAIQLAMQKNWQEKRLTRGASTINQQLAKNLFLSSSRNPVRKLHEALIAVEMKYILGERRTLEFYLNVIEWGDGIYGAEAAARHYFNTSAAVLNVEQAAFLATIIPNPLGNHDPAVPSSHVQERISRILILMSHPLLRHPLLEDAGHANVR